MITCRFSSLLALLGILFLFAAVPASVSAQQLPDPLGYGTPNVKDYGREGYPDITVYVWGNADTGVWRVEDGTDLLEFVSVISRLQFGAQRPDSRSVQTLRLYREGRAEGKPFFETRVEELFTMNGAYPALEEGDVLVLDTSVRSRFTWRDIREVVGTAVLLLNTYLLVEGLR